MIYKLTSYIKSIFFPEHCYICKKTKNNLCIECIDSCRKSLSTPYPYIISSFDFRDEIIKKIIHAIKYYNRRDLINPLVLYSFNELDEDITHKLKSEKYTIIPIPMPLFRKYKRGYNQAELISNEFSKLLDIEVSNKILSRKLFTNRQVETRNRSERLKNQKNTFLIKGNINNKSFLLVDDVTTTGATFEEARNILLKSGAKSVLALSLAH